MNVWARPEWRYLVVCIVVKLAPLRESRAPIWGIGQWAVEQYRAEFGEERTYLNVPYFSDLQRFVDVSSSGIFTLKLGIFCFPVR